MSERNSARNGPDSGNADSTDASGEGDDGVLGGLDRRQYLKLGAATAAGAAGISRLSGTSNAQSRDGISFDRVVDAVDDLGMDPNGNEPIDSKLDQGWSSGTLIEFPPGDYLVTREHGYYSDDNVGIVGKSGDRSDVQFVFPDGYDDRFLVVRNGQNWLFGDFTIQQSSDTSTGVGCAFGVDRNMTLRNVEIDGFNPRSKQRGLAIAVYDSDGEATIDGYIRNGRSAVGNYPTGTQAMLVPNGHRGKLTITNTRIENAGENGIYGSQNPGDVCIEDSYFANNDIASVRIAGGGSYVKNSTFVVDTDGDDNRGDYDNARGLWFESGSLGLDGGVAENCDFILRSADNSGGLVRIDGSASNIEIRDCRFRNDTKYPTLFAQSGPGSITVENSSFTGDGTAPRQDFGFVGIEDRNGSTVSGCCISGSGPRNGVYIRSSSGCTVRRSTIDVGGDAIASPSSNVATSGLSYSGSCPLPSDSGSGAGGSTGGSSDGSDDSDDSDDAESSDDSGSSESTDDAESTDDSGSDSGTSSDDGESDSGGDAGGATGGTSTLRLTADTTSPYEFTVSGDLSFNESFGTEDRIDGSTASGVLAGGTDSYQFSGDITSFSIEGSPTVLLDGESVDPDSLGGGSSGGSSDGSDDAEDASTETSTDEGRGGEDDAEDTESTDDADDGGSSGGSGGSSDGMHALRLSGEDVSPYEFTVSGDVGFDPAFGTEDRIDGSTVSGVLAGGIDSYQFSGSITSFSIEGSPTVLLDGESVDPDSLGGGSSGGSSDGSDDAEDTSTETPTDDGGSDDGGSSDTESGDTEETTSDDSGSEDATDESSDDDGALANVVVLQSDDLSPYEVEVSGDIAFDPNWGTEDSISDDGASGVLNGGGDAYRFSGEITSFEYEGDVHVRLNGESVDPSELAG